MGNTFTVIKVDKLSLIPMRVASVLQALCSFSLAVSDIMVIS
ncbi:hypothetical protein [Shewanella phaeophyticola]|uniref:Uncharacterized protein n=1 Tax=Shewanella phaeophyticola TaxID=2978345 RepID=A0ABT2P6N1_9GAMM|nr:hypothetical protein [Shewanella sp. KJ10-1]MCT8988317.1 hypothetical protein [Shewanella sp. KJ10-1]